MPDLNPQTHHSAKPTTMQPDPWLGQPLADGRYVVGEKLGEGGMGRVYLARDTRLDIVVVIKSPHPVLLSESEFKQRFSREVRTLLKLQHPHIIRVLDFAEHEGVPFAVLEYLPSGSLADQIATSNGVRPVESLARWLPHAAEALDYLHERSIVHRDIKPANLFFDENGHVRLGDFGIVKSLRSDKTKTSALTGTGMTLGTPEYMAPELALGEDYDGRVDQYALAVTVYEALCGSVPYFGTTSAAVLVAQLSRSRAPESRKRSFREPVPKQSLGTSAIPAGSAHITSRRKLEPLSLHNHFANRSTRSNAFDRLARRIFHALDVVVALEIQPTLRVGAKKTREP